jgi:hypothetical protein
MWHVGGEKRMTYRALVWKPVRKRPLGRPRSRWEDNTKMDVKEIEWSRLIWFRIRTSGELL